MNTLLPGFNVAMGGWSSGCSRHRLTTFNPRSPRDRSTVPTGFRRQPDSTGPTRRLDAIDCTRQNMPNVQVRRWSNWENPTKKLLKIDALFNDAVPCSVSNQGFNAASPRQRHVQAAASPLRPVGGLLVCSWRIICTLVCVASADI